MASSLEKRDLPENYIYISHLVGERGTDGKTIKEPYFIIPTDPDSIADSLTSTFQQNTSLSRSAPIYTYSNSGPRTVQFSFKLHRDMMDEFNKGVGGYHLGEGEDYVDGLVRVIRENATGVRVIKALGKEDAEKERFENVNKTLIKAEEKSEKRMATLSPIINFVLNAGLVFVIVIGAVRVNNGVLAPGKILAFTTYFTIILNAMLSITRLFIIYSKANASAIRIAEILDKPRVNKNNEETLKRIKTSDDYITFEDVTFSYHKKYNNVSNISFSIKKRETLGIIGATGSGKSTIMQLLMRFYEADSGNIYVDGINIKNISKENYHKLFGVVFQNDMIFSDTIYENIAMYRDIPLEQIKKAAYAASIDDFIETLPDKYDTLLNAKGTNLSGGQKLRILIARSLCNNPNILILDDASSALDYKTDATIRNRIKEMYQDTTMIVIAQRVSSVMNADKIVLLEEGEIIGYGTHQELFHKSLVYQEIYKLQMGVTDDAN